MLKQEQFPQNHRRKGGDGSIINNQFLLESKWTLVQNLKELPEGVEEIMCTRLKISSGVVSGRASHVKHSQIKRAAVVTPYQIAENSCFFFFKKKYKFKYTSII